MAMGALTDGPVLTFGRTECAHVQVADLSLDRLGRPSFVLRTGDGSVPVTLPAVGAHQAFNAAAATAAGLTLGITLDAAAATLATAALSGQRLELRNLANDVTLLDDTYNASPGSVRSSIDALASVEGKRRIAVLGEIRELGDASAAEHRAAGRYAASRVDLVVAVGENARPLAEGAGDQAVVLSDNAAAADWLHRHLCAGDVVLIKASRGAHLDEVADALA
jgi:UDP-N-acetylmuramoyl-tripeptide--D-alanyl-D-alanine ligase